MSDTVKLIEELSSLLPSKKPLKESEGYLEEMVELAKQELEKHPNMDLKDMLDYQYDAYTLVEAWNELPSQEHLTEVLNGVKEDLTNYIQEEMKAE